MRFGERRHLGCVAPTVLDALATFAVPGEASGPASGCEDDRGSFTVAGRDRPAVLRRDRLRRSVRLLLRVAPTSASRAFTLTCTPPLPPPRPANSPPSRRITGTTRRQARNYFIDGFTETFRNLQRSMAPGLAHARGLRLEGAEGRARRGDSLVIHPDRDDRCRPGDHGNMADPRHREQSHDRSSGTNAVASYIVMVCRPRSQTARTAARWLTSTGRLRRELRPGGPRSSGRFNPARGPRSGCHGTGNADLLALSGRPRPVGTASAGRARTPPDQRRVGGGA